MYVKTNWENDNLPAINAENLNNMEEGIKAAHDLIEGIVEEINKIKTDLEKR